ncbi:MAG: hypothetical protein HOP29_19160 [Phycisphaerales bacterium]|nr:hypothetical protein [Phycisphaerales bacterium]
MIFAAASSASDLNLRVTAELSSQVIVAPGAVVNFEVRAKLADADNQGLAAILFDLSFDGGPLAAMNTPSSSPMSQFVLPVGITNPIGFGGTPSAGALIQVGGLQNTIGNSVVYAPFPIGTVVTDVARNREAVIATGSLTAPLTVGVYAVTPSNLIATAITAASTGDPFWQVQPAAAGSIAALTIEVAASPLPTATIAALGPRYLSVTPAPGSGPVALRLSGDQVDPDVACIAHYVQPDGSLQPTQFVQNADAWGTIVIRDDEVLPGAGFRMFAEYTGVPASPMAAFTYAWGDTNNDGGVDIFDILCVLDGFAGVFSQCTFHEVDLTGAVPDALIDIFDILAVLDAFSGAPYALSDPCP